MSKSAVIAEQARPLDYLHDFVVLPQCYGKPEYDSREDVIAIREAVNAALDKLDARVGFTGRLKGHRPVIIKPNLVSVYHDSGFDERDYPETTDPRVFDAVVRYIARYTDDITIAESSGKPMPTTASFGIAGYDRIAKHYGAKLVALERRPVVRYMLPKAEVMKEVYIPDTLDRAVKGEAFYISVPKMKTNLYTGVTLGFKNAMGTIPYFLRERNHSYLINKKLADLLYLFKPDLTVIDGIIGGEGNTPAPVDPVRVGRIVAGNNSVETDRVATRMMGFDPDGNELMLEAERRGFGDPDAEISGDVSPIQFRPAISSFMDEKTEREFPNLLVLAGHTINGAPEITDINSVTPETALALEQACTGGCLAAAKTGLDYYNFKKSVKRDFKLCIVTGSGVDIEGERYWFDKTGKPYSTADIKALDMHRLALGNCAAAAREACDYSAEGCCDPAVCMAVVCRAAGVTMPIMSLKNKGLVRTVLGMKGTVLARRRHIRKGRYIDCPRCHEDRIFGLPELSPEDSEKDYVEWPLPPMTDGEKRQQLKNQWSIITSAMKTGKRRKTSLLQLAGYALTAIIWTASIIAAHAYAFPWILCALAALHIAETVIIGYRTGKERGVSGAQSIVMCLLFGFIWWLPLRLHKDKEQNKDIAHRVEMQG